MKIVMTRWKWGRTDRLTWGDYTITAVGAPYEKRWIISRGGRPASALIFKSLRDAVRLAEWDAAVREQAMHR